MPRTKPTPHNAEVDFRGEKPSNATHASTTDPDARFYKKAPCTGTALCFIGHGLMENRSGLIVDADLTRATARRAAGRNRLDPPPFAGFDTAATRQPTQMRKPTPRKSKE
ncbi:hypothetical protein JC607_18325 [Paracoccus sp. IB05]|nr:hypothetical protein [Paracoccus sp. IB05]